MKYGDVLQYAEEQENPTEVFMFIGRDPRGYLKVILLMTDAEEEDWKSGLVTLAGRNELKPIMPR